MGKREGGACDQPRQDKTTSTHNGAWKKNFSLVYIRIKGEGTFKAEGQRRKNGHPPLENHRERWGTRQEAEHESEHVSSWPNTLAGRDLCAQFEGSSNEGVRAENQLFARSGGVEQFTIVRN